MSQKIKGWWLQNDAERGSIYKLCSYNQEDKGLMAAISNQSNVTRSNRTIKKTNCLNDINRSNTTAISNQGSNVIVSNIARNNEKTQEKHKINTVSAYFGTNSVYNNLLLLNSKKQHMEMDNIEIKNSDEFYKKILSFNLTTKKQFSCISRIPKQFKSYDEYYKAFEPLLLNEAKDTILKGINESKQKKKAYAKLIEQVNLDNYLELTFVVDQAFPDFEILLFSQLSNNESVKPINTTSDTNDSFLGIVSDSRQFSGWYVTVKAQKNTCNLMLNSTFVYYDIACFSSFYREYMALCRLKFSVHLPFILAYENRKTAPLVSDSNLVHKIICRMKSLNKSQENAIMNVYTGTSFFSLIHGPPGTGKTKVIVSLVESLFDSQIINSMKEKILNMSGGPRVLICAPSNAAVDELAERISKICVNNEKFSKLQIIRIGVLNNINEKLKSLTLDFIIEKELTERKNMLNITNIELSSSDRTRRKFELLKSSNVVCATLSSSAKELIKIANIDFDIIIIDEACQSVETSTLIPLKFNPIKIVLVGDPKQLPPTLISNYRPYEQSLFTRLHKTQFSVLLNIQYRMNPTIAEFPSFFFYDNRLLTHTSVAKRINPFDKIIQPISFVHVIGKERIDGYFSFYNIAEAQYIGNIVCELLKRTSNYECTHKIGVITPYKAQMNRIKEILLSI